MDLNTLRASRDQVVSLYPWTAQDLTLSDPNNPIRKGASGHLVKNVQEFLSLNGSALTVDSEFGEITEAAVRDYQTASGLPVTGAVDDDTLLMLAAKLIGAAAASAAAGASDMQTAVKQFAQAHLRAGARELNGDNTGPWVRLFMRGVDGSAEAWCDGFVGFVCEQAANLLGQDPPIPYNVNVPATGRWAAQENRLFHAENYDKATALAQILTPAAFIIRDSAGGSHIGLVIDFQDAAFVTIEGNWSNKVCSNDRPYALQPVAGQNQHPGFDFIKMFDFAPKAAV